MGLEDYVLRTVSELSGGEAQKVTLAQQSRLLLLGKPTSSLDPRNQHRALQTVRAVPVGPYVSVHPLHLTGIRSRKPCGARLPGPYREKRCRERTAARDLPGLRASGDRSIEGGHAPQCPADPV